MASSAGAPVRGGAAPDGRAPFDAVLADAHDRERLRLVRYRQRWIAQQVAVFLMAAVAIVATLPVLFGVLYGDHALSGISSVVVFLTGGWLGYVVLMAIVTAAGLAAAVALARLVGVLRTDDLAAYERSHQPWWTAFRG